MDAIGLRSVEEDTMHAMSRPKLTGLLAVLATLAMTVVALAGVPARGGAFAPSAGPPTKFSAAEAIAQITGPDGVLRFDVAENATRFAWSGKPELVDGMPAGSTPYVTQGYIYPEETLTNSNGVNPDGSPEFPDKVLGQWSCYGWYLGGGPVPGSANWLTTHLFNFGGEWGTATLVSEGYSIDDMGVPLERAITGGTGPYEGARGMQMETNLGFNESNGMNFRYELHVAGE
jgi:hypothetical protein